MATRLNIILAKQLLGEKIWNELTLRGVTLKHLIKVRCVRGVDNFLICCELLAQGFVKSDAIPSVNKCNIYKAGMRKTHEQIEHQKNVSKK